MKKIPRRRRLHVHAARLAFISASFWVVFYWMPRLNSLTWVAAENEALPLATSTASVVAYVPTRVGPPDAIKAVYMSSWVAGTQTFRDHVLRLVDETEANAIVVDIKDYSGKISYHVIDPELQKVGADENRISDIRGLIDYLHSRGVYVIGRISVFQDPYYVKLHPELAVLSARTGAPWKDRKGLAWLDPGSREVWDYIIRLGKETWGHGVDELNFDYIRFPSDGDLKDMRFRFYDATLKTKSDQMREFFAYLKKGFEGTGAVLSADLFGMTATETNDLNIGQLLEDAIPYFDYLSPMVYPSHYSDGFNGYQNPAAHPYEIVKYSMDRAVARLIAASSTPEKLRPWLQDFDLGATYTPEMIRKEKQAVYDAGIKSWMLWDPKNKYTRAALD